MSGRQLLVFEDLYDFACFPSFGLGQIFPDVEDTKEGGDDVDGDEGRGADQVEERAAGEGCDHVDYLEMSLIIEKAGGGYRILGEGDSGHHAPVLEGD